ncbi:hypothetical protein C9374_006818 [Naegleria lovaniensis]|uniref:cholesterol 7-desaturase n=1 Tax=Naegleria lovaniensis TaxID=51637 RepID=A0AA88H5M6_NAELO|nr:uncharacterized protein C9374_006818 [Naegleria lovaniensis]KAG2393287.1 hypothetical protein C9374_006818 [Naegleria lovaniensis]
MFFLNSLSSHADTTVTTQESFLFSSNTNDHSLLFLLSLSVNIVLLIAFLSRWFCCFSRNTQSSRIQPSKQQVEKERSDTFIQQYPNGWYRLCNSSDLSPGQSKLVNYFGKELVIFRGQQLSVDTLPVVGVLDAYCPHLGANLGIQGKVVGNHLQCAFHHWEFDKDGQCVNIPYVDSCNSIPSCAKTYSNTPWICVEKYGMILVWYHSEKEPPSYEPISIPELDNKSNSKYYHYGNFEYADIRMNIQDFAENSADVQHFQPLHGEMALPWTGPRSCIGRTIPVPFVKIIHKASFELSQTEKHVAYFKNQACLEVFGKKLPSTTVDAQITFFGPGGITLFQFDGSFGRIYLFHTHTPTSITSLDVGFVCFAENKIPRMLVWYIVGNWIAQWQNDILVWENKMYMKKPLLVKNDGPVMKLRRWYKQFYSTQELSY